MPGFSDINLYQNFLGATYVYNGTAPEPVGYSFKIPMTSLKDSEGVYWPTDEIVVQVYNTTAKTYTKVPTSEWQIYNNTIYIQSSAVTLPGSAATTKITIFRIPSIGQEYTGESWNVLSPEGIANGLDHVARMAQRALFEAHRALKVHPQDTPAYDPFNGQNIPGALTIPQSGADVANKAIGYDPTGTKIIAIGDSITAQVDEDATPGTAVLRDSTGRIASVGIDITPQAEPSFMEGRMWYDSTEHIMKFYTDVAGSSMDIGKELWVRVLNKTGADIADGKVVYISGAQGGKTTVALARADAVATSDTFIGVTTSPILNNGEGLVCINGEIRGQNTNAYLDGDILYLSESTAGGLTTTRPTGSNLVIQVGYVSYKHVSNGRILVVPRLRGSSGPVALAPVVRDAAGRFQAVDPSAAQDVATRAYIMSLLNGNISDNQSVKSQSSTVNFTSGQYIPIATVVNDINNILFFIDVLMPSSYGTAVVMLKHQGGSPTKAKILKIIGSVDTTAYGFLLSTDAGGNYKLDFYSSAPSYASAIVRVKAFGNLGATTLHAPTTSQAAMSGTVARFTLDITKSNTENAVQEWSGNETYNQYAVISKLGVIYRSVVADNNNHDPATDTTGTYWTPAGGGSNLIDYFTVGATAVTAGQWLTIQGGGVVPASMTSWESLQVIGVALTGGASGATIKVQTAGVIRNYSSGMSTGTAFFLGINGAGITDTGGTAYSTYLVRLGVAVNSTDLLVAVDVFDRYDKNNYIINPDAHLGSSYWSVYNDSSGVTPVDGVGGSFTGSTARNNTSPLGWDTDFQIGHTSSSMLGQGVAYGNIYIKGGDVGRPFQISFSYKTSASPAYVSGDLTLWVYDVTNGVLLPTTNQSIPATNGSAQVFTSQFLATNSTIYRIIWHISTANTAAWTMNIANLNFWPYNGAVGAAVGPWTPYPAGTYTVPGVASGVTVASGKVPAMNVTTNPTKGTSTFDLAEYRRVGDSMQIHLKFVSSTGGVDGSGNFIVPLPLGYTLRDSFVGSPSALNERNISGYGLLNTGGSSYYMQVIPAANNAFGFRASNNSVDTWITTAVVSGTAGFEAFIEVPIAQWVGGGVVQLADAGQGPMFLSNTSFTADANASVSGSYYGADGAPINTAITTTRSASMTLQRQLLPTETMQLELYHTNGRWVPIQLAKIADAGTYPVDMNALTQPGPTAYGMGIFEAAGTSTTVVINQYTLASSRSGQNTTWASAVAAGYTRWRIRIAPISAVEIPTKIRASYADSSVALTANSPINVTTKDFDSHSSYSAGRFTCPRGGYLRVTYDAYVSSTGRNYSIYKNGANHKKLGNPFASGTSVFYSLIVQVSQGDIIDVRSDAGSLTDSNVTIQFELETM